MSFWSRLEEAAIKNEMRIALLFHDEQITYKDLFSKANNYAHELAYRGIKKDDIVCVLGHRSPELFACILGIIQVGAVFLLIDSEDEWSKIEYRMKNSKCRYAFVDERYQKYNSVPEAIGLQDVYKREHPSVNCIDRNAEDTMYLAYTSGSTAQEKAVMVSYGNMESYIDAFIAVFGICDTDVNVQQTPLGYDGLCEELFSMLFTGGKLLLLDKRILQSPRLLHKELLKNKVTLFPTTPLILNELNRLPPVETIKKYISCADVLKKYHYSNLMKHTQIYNTYGPTETTVCATYFLCGSEDDLFTPIGTLEKSKASVATMAAIAIGLVGTIFMALSTFAVTHEPPQIALCIFFAIPGFIGWGLPYFVYKKILRRRTVKITPLVEQKYDELYEICEKGNNLLSK